jgi:hypothetical protein
VQTGGVSLNWEEDVDENVINYKLYFVFPSSSLFVFLLLQREKRKN